MGVTQWIINQIPPHRVYIEPFLGGGAVLRLKAPAVSSIALERDARALALWKGFDLPDLRVIRGDALRWLEKFKPVGDEFIYCDPPYLLGTKTAASPMYRFVLTDGDHERLLKCLRKLDCSIAISGYASAMYSRLLGDWRVSKFSTYKRNNERSEECLWMNYPEPIALHDYRYLGANFRERERIKRQKLRWARRLGAMSILQRRALMATLAECDDNQSCIAGNGVNGRSAATSTIAFRDPAGVIVGNDDSTRLHRRKRRAPALLARNGAASGASP